MDHFIAYSHSMLSIQGLGKLSETKLMELQSSVSLLFSHVTEYTSSTPDSQVSSMLGLLMKMLEHGLARLGSLWMNFRQMSFSVTDVQRCWLEVTAILDYMTVLKPRMDSTTGNNLPHPVANTVGVFTMEVHIVQDFFHAGLPCWLIRPASVWSNINILEVIPLRSPTDYLVLKPHRVYCPPVYVGPVMAPERHRAILRFTRGFLRYPDPFSITIDGEDAPVSSALDVAPQSSARSSARCSSTRSTWNPSNRPTANRFQENRENRTRGKTPYERMGN